MNLIEQLGNSIWNSDPIILCPEPGEAKLPLYLSAISISVPISGVYNGVQVTSTIDFLQNTITDKYGFQPVQLQTYLQVKCLSELKTKTFVCD